MVCDAAAGESGASSGERCAIVDDSDAVDGSDGGVEGCAKNVVDVTMTVFFCW